MTEAKPRVFLSYARTDRLRVTRIAEGLVGAGLTVWWDTAIEGGSSFSADIERELDAADVVVVVWSAASVKSDWVRDEASAGRDRKRLVPVQIDATPPPLGFRQLQSIDLAGWKGRDGDAKFVSLVSAVNKLAGSAVAAPAAIPAPTSFSRRTLIGGGVGVAALAAGGFGTWKLLGRKADDGTASVVVLPFANLSSDPAQAFFADGIAEELRNALSQIRGLKVIGRVSSEKFRATDDLPAAAETLGVDHVLTGSVRRSPTTLRIGAQLVDGRTGVESWSQSYDQPVGDSLTIQSKIANSVVTALSTRLAKAAGTVVVGGTSNPKAQELLLKGRTGFQSDPSEVGIRQYIALLDAAIALDPDYAEAWAAKGYMSANLTNFISSATARTSLQNDAMDASQRAVALAPGLGFAHISLASRYADNLDVRRARTEVETAATLAPAVPLVLANISFVQRAFDPDRAIASARQAIALDPFNPAYFDRYGQALIAARRYEDAADADRNAVNLSNNPRRGWIAVGAALGLNQIAAARAALPLLLDDTLRLALTAIVEARGGNHTASEAALAKLRLGDSGSVNYALARIHSQRGETAAALDAIEASFRMREKPLWLIAVDQFLDPIRREPRFKAVQDAVVPPDIWVPPKRG